MYNDNNAYYPPGNNGQAGPPPQYGNQQHQPAAFNTHAPQGNPGTNGHAQHQHPAAYPAPPPPQQQPQYNASPSQQHQAAAGPAQQPYYDIPTPQPTHRPPPTTTGLGVSSVVNDNPFGPGTLPKVTPVTMEMRKRKAIEIAQRHLAKGGAASPSTNLQADDAEELALKAMNEHNHPQLEMTDDLDKHEARLGSGILYLFSFMRFLFLMSVVFAVFQSITFGNYIRREDPDFSITGNTADGDKIWLDNFMISAYSSDDDKRLWLAMNIICTIITFFSAPIYFWYLRRGEKTSKYVDVDGEDIIIRFTSEGKIDVANLYRGRIEVVLRRLISLTVIAVLVGLQVVASYFITQNSVTNIGISFAISIVVAALNVLFLLIAERLTEFECWASFERWKRFHTLKLLFFRLANIITVFAAKRYDSSENVKCAYDIIGQQLVTLLVIDIFAINAKEVIVNMVWNKHADVYTSVTNSIFGDQDNLPKFDIALEYLQVVYRQYLVIMAMVVMPFSIFLSMVGFLIDYGTKKFILTKLSGVPRKVESSQKALLTFVLFFVALSALLTPFAGSMFMMSGLTRDKSNLCTFP